MSEPWTSQPWTADGLLDAIGAYCSGTIDEREGRRLDEALANDPQARGLFGNYMWLHACLLAEHGTLAVEENSGGAGHDEAIAQGLSLLNLQEHEAASRRAGAKIGGRRWAVAAAILCVAGLSSWATVAVVNRHSADAVADAHGGRADVVARITGTRNCIWRQPELGIGYGSSLAPGQRLELDDGLAEITFEDGATVLLEGPATFDVDAADHVILQSGRLAAIVPERARGFRLQTVSLDVSDVGAEYGVAAQASGDAELHVFNGVVKADVRDAQGNRLRRIELSAAQAARVSPLSTTVLEFPADDAKFVRNIAPTYGPGDGLLAYEGFRYPEGPLESQNGGFGWAGPWFNLSVDEAAGPESNQVKPGSLSVGGLVPVGNRAVIASQHNRIRRALGTSVGGVFDAEGLVENKDEMRLIGRDGKTIYVSFLQRVSKTGDGFYGVELHRGDGNGNRVLCVGNGADGAGYGATSNVNVYGPENLPSLGDENADVNFIVIKITYGVDNRDVCEVYRNPESLRDESACKVDATLRGNFAFDRISLADFDGSKVHEVDEVRVGTHFLAVTGRWGNNQGRLLRQVTMGLLPMERVALLDERARGAMRATNVERGTALLPLALGAR